MMGRECVCELTATRVCVNTIYMHQVAYYSNIISVLLLTSSLTLKAFL